MAAIVYHAPFPLDREASSASGIRPVRMLDAFRELGYTVLDVTGSARERSRRLRALRDRLQGGERIEFLYSECATIPTMLTEPRHIPPHPFVDPALMGLMHRHGVPTSLFYRDIYWAFPDYRERVGAALATAMGCVYRYDLAWYSRYIDRLYLPSMRMGAHVPGFPEERMAPLPPGCEIVDEAPLLPLRRRAPPALHRRAGWPLPAPGVPACRRRRARHQPDHLHPPRPVGGGR